VLPLLLFYRESDSRLSGQVLTTIAGGKNGLALIYAGRVISGVGIGAISAVAPAFVSECSPKDVRGRITGMFQIMVRRRARFLLLANPGFLEKVALGVMISYFVNCKSCAIA